MKKLILIAVSLIMFSVSAFADKPTSYVELETIHGNINFNVSTKVGEDTKYIPLVINLDGVAVTSDGGRRGVRIIKTIGTLTDVPLKGKDLYNAMPSWAKPALKELYLEAINADVTQ